MLCDAGEGERLAFRPALQRQLEKFIALLENRAEYLQSLQKPSLKALFEAQAVKNDQELKFGQNFMLRCYPQLLQEQKDELAEWEAMLCEPGEGERLAFRPALQRQLEKFIALLEDRAEYFQSLQKPSLKSLFEAHAVKNDQGLKFGQNFMRRCYPKLSQGQKDELAEWEAMLCEPGEGERLAFRPALQRQVDRFVALLASRRAEFLQEKESSLGALFRAARRGRDKDWRFGHEFVSRVLPKLSERWRRRCSRQQLLAYARQRGRRARLRTSPSCMSRSARSATTCLARGCQSACASYTATAWTRRPASEPSSTECTRWTRFCRSKSLRPASTARKGGSGPPGHATPCRARSRPLPSRRATLSLRQRRTLEPGKAICCNCLSEAVHGPRKGSPTAETDALTFFEEELLSPIQHIVRIFTLHATGQCELRGHVGNLFQNGPQYVRQIPALVGDTKMLLVRRCPKDPARKQRVPFLDGRPWRPTACRFGQPAGCNPAPGLRGAECRLRRAWRRRACRCGRPSDCSTTERLTHSGLGNVPQVRRGAERRVFRGGSAS